jgi:hypothetical protein
VVGEAKFGPSLTAAQLQAYVTHQVARLDGGPGGAQVVLVPSYRRLQAEGVLSALGSSANEPSVFACVGGHLGADLG